MKCLVIACFLACLGTIAAARDVMKMAVTTSFHNSGLAEVLLPEIAKDLDIEVQLLVVGTGQAIRLGQSGDVDAILVHARAAEDAFVAQGFGTHRRDIMYNDFVIVGPTDDPALVRSATSATTALNGIASAQVAFVSRGDDSGTHKKELALWRSAGLDPTGFGVWYKAVGAGMGAALNTTSGLNAYTLADRASWLNFGNKGDLVLLFEGDPDLFNQYGYLPVNPARHKHVRHDLAIQVEAWLTSQTAAVLINGYKIDGQNLFTFNALP